MSLVRPLAIGAPNIKLFVVARQLRQQRTNASAGGHDEIFLIRTIRHEIVKAFEKFFVVPLDGVCFGHIRTACVARGNGVGKLLGIGVTGRRQTLTGRLSAACLPLLLAACAHQPLTRSCIAKAQYEQMKATEPAKVRGKFTGKADADIRPVTGSAVELRAWGEAELGLLAICASDPNKP